MSGGAQIGRAGFSSTLLMKRSLTGFGLNEPSVSWPLPSNGAEGRAHIILSGRLTDWEFRRDLQRLQEELPIAIKPAAPPLLTPEDLVVRTIRRERSEAAEEAV
jgi:hypothetical protein